VRACYGPFILSNPLNLGQGQEFEDSKEEVVYSRGGRALSMMPDRRYLWPMSWI
jgi:hypothetical protein